MNAAHISTDVNHMDNSKIDWFVLNGTDNGTENTFDNETFGIVERDGKKSVVYFDGEPLRNDLISAIVLRECEQ